MENLENAYGDDFDDIFEDSNESHNDPQPQPQPTPQNPTANPVDSSEDTLELEDIFNDPDNPDDDDIPALDAFLQSKGIKDSMVSIEGENGETESINFHDLDKEEQFEILNSLTTTETVNTSNLSQEEEAWLAELKNNNLDINSFLELYKNSILEETNQSKIDSYEIDSYSDMELFLLDLQNRYDLSDEELQAELEKELKDEDMFARKVGTLRQEYKQLEEQQNKEREAEFQQQQHQEYQRFANQMVEIAQRKGEFHGLELEDEDKNNTLSYMLDLDDNGQSRMAKDLEDPNNLYEIAWYLQYGKDAFKIIENAYESEIARLKKTQDSPRVVRQKPQERKIKNINELY